MNNTDTIAAVATGSTISAIGIVRISGEKALTAADNVFTAVNGIKLCDAEDRKMYYGKLTDAHGELIDYCLCMVSRAPHSYTGEDTVELHCHGSPVVLIETLRALFKRGVRQAQAGEFTKRAFLNGRMDLTQAEAVIDLIEAETPCGAKNAAGQLGGAVFGKISAIYDRLIDITAHFHAVIDYPDEDIDEFKMSQYGAVLRESEAELRLLLDTHERGKVLKNGIPTAIVGRTNVGKSSLLNALLGYERAIVTEVPGTTRDTVEEKVLIGDVLLRLIDTAGLRESNDTVERLGMERTKSALENAELILAVLDGSETLQEDDRVMLESLPIDTPVIVVVNKSDLPAKIEIGDGSGFLLPQKIQKSENPTFESVAISALTGEGLDELCQKIQSLFPDKDNYVSGEIITSVRQAQAISKAVEALQQAQTALTAMVSPDAVLTDIEAALEALGEVTGKVIREDVVSRIFERFCVGK